MPSRTILEACARRNPDGFGFVSETRKFKSMDFEEFYKELRKVGKNEECIIHFRWATHGTVNKRNCHPFYHRVNGGVYFAHNGILPIEPIGDMTDSETAFREILVPVIREYGFDSQELADAVDEIIGGSKFAMMHKGKVRRFGNFQEVNGVYYSNLYFMSLLRPVTYAPSFRWAI